MYYFYLDGVLLPVAPENFKWKINNKNKTTTLINEGEVNFLKDAGLTDFEFEVLIPAVQYGFAKYDGGFKSPSYFTDHFERLKTSKKPFQFICTRMFPNGKLISDTNVSVSLEQYEVEESAENGLDLIVSIKLKQFKPYGTKVVTVTNNTVSVNPTREENNSPAPKQDETYTVQKGDCLWNIAKKIYGNGAKYTVIYEANKDKITNPNLIYPNQVLVIPAL